MFGVFCPWLWFWFMQTHVCVRVCLSVCVASVFVCGESHRGFFIFLQQVYSLLRFACDLQRLIGALQMLRESPRCLPPFLSPSLSSFLSLSLSLCAANDFPELLYYFPKCHTWAQLRSRAERSAALNRSRSCPRALINFIVTRGSRGSTVPGLL